MVSEALNLLVVLAAPILYARWRTQASSAELRLALEARVAALAAFCASARGSPDAERFRKAAPQLRAFSEAVAREPPESLPVAGWFAQAQECLAALGFETPPSGWESFQGWSAGGE